MSDLPRQQLGAADRWGHGPGWLDGGGEIGGAHAATRFPKWCGATPARRDPTGWT